MRETYPKIAVDERGNGSLARLTGSQADALEREEIERRRAEAAAPRVHVPAVADDGRREELAPGATARDARDLRRPDGDRLDVYRRTRQVVDYVFYLVYGLIGLLVVLDLLGAREESPFKQLVDTVASPLVSPFEGLMPEPEAGALQLRVSLIVGLFVYFLVHLAVRGLLRLFEPRTREA